jgi:hypothetical protein
MKNLVTLLALIFIPALSNAITYDQSVLCKNGVCEKRELYKGIAGPDLKIEDLQVNSCLLDVANSKFFRIENLEVKNKKVVLLSEVGEDKVSVEIQRETIYSDSHEFNVKLRIIPCANVDGYIINNEARYTKCLQDNGRHSLKMFCEKERVKNF